MQALRVSAFWWLLVFVLVAGDSSDQPTNLCHIEVLSRAGTSSKYSYINVNGMRMASFAEFEEHPSYVAVMIGHNCLPPDFKHVFYYLEDLEEAFDLAPRGTVFAIAVNRIYDVLQYIYEPLEIYDEGRNHDLFHVLRKMGVDIYSEGELVYAYDIGNTDEGDYALPSTFDNSLERGAFSLVVRKGYPHQTDLRIITRRSRDLVHNFYVPIDDRCISTLPPPMLLMSPRAIHQQQLAMQVAFYDRLFCGGKVYGWEYVPNAEAEVYFSIWSVRETSMRMPATLRAFTLVNTRGYSDDIHYKCLDPRERINTKFGDVYGLHYSRQYRHQPGAQAAIQALDCDNDNDYHGRCKQDEAFACGRTVYNGDIDTIAVADVAHQDILEHGHVIDLGGTFQRSLGLRPILEADFVYTCGCHDDEDCHRGGDVYMVCDDGQCRCRERYTYNRRDNRCGTVLSLGKHAWQRSTLNDVYGASLAVDDDEEGTCSYTDPFDVIPTNGHAGNILEEHDFLYGMSGIARRKRAIVQVGGGSKVEPDIVDEAQSRTAADKPKAGDTQNNDEDDDDEVDDDEDKNVQRSGIDERMEKQKKKLVLAAGQFAEQQWGAEDDDDGEEVVAPKGVALPPGQERRINYNYYTFEHVLSWFVFVYESYYDGKALRRPWFVLDIGYEARVHAVSITTPPTIDDYIRLWSGGDRLLLRDDAIDTEFSADSTQVHIKGYSYWMLFDSPHFNGSYDIVGPPLGGGGVAEHEVLVGTFGYVGAVKRIADELVCIQHVPSNLFVSVENGVLLLGDKCKDYFYQVQEEGLVLHAQTSQAIYIPSYRIGEHARLSHVSAGDSFEVSFDEVGKTLQMHLDYEGDLCLGVTNAVTGAPIVLTTEPCASWVLQLPLRHKHRIHQVKTESFYGDEGGYIDFEIESDRRQMINENPHCLRVEATDEYGTEVPVIHIQSIGYKRKVPDRVELFGGSGEVSVTYSQSERGDTSLDRFEVLVTNHVNAEDAPVATNENRCTKYRGSVREGATMHLSCDRVINGRYITIAKYQMMSNYHYNILSMCDFQVFGSPVRLHGSECHEDGECLVHGDHHLYCGMDGHCHCQHGYYYPSKETDLCVDVDECSSSVCSHYCVNTLGSYHCECPASMVISPDEHVCIDDSECRNDNSHCEHECHELSHTEGGYFCTCRHGYRLQRDHHSCTDIDECAEMNHNCTGDPKAECVNTLGDYKCRCPYSELGIIWDGSKCTARQGTVHSFCDVSNGLCAHHCLHLGRHFFHVECRCDDGYELADDKRSCLGDGLCTTANGGCMHVCHDEDGMAVCGCYAGYYLQPDGRTCHDLDECEVDNGGCWDKCVNTPGSSTCLCLESVPIMGGRRCIVADLAMVFEVHLTGTWNEELAHRQSPEFHHLAGLIKDKLDSPHYYTPERHQLHVKFEVSEFFGSAHELGVRLVAISPMPLSIEDRAEAILSLGPALRSLAVLYKGEHLTISGQVLYISDAEGGVAHKHGIHTACDVFSAVGYCLHGGTCEVNHKTGKPCCRCTTEYAGARCEREALQYHPLTETQFGLVLGALMLILVLVTMGVAMCWWCCCREESRRPDERAPHLETLHPGTQIDPVYSNFYGGTTPYFSPWGTWKRWTQQPQQIAAPQALTYM